ncbi:MAG: hypothetical protein IKM78_06930 [Prevotella sp.]|nr:hypothetical protein [Prevotella sp.]
MYDWLDRCVGYVASSDLPYAWWALHCCGKPTIKGTIVDTDKEHHCLFFEAIVEGYDGQKADLYPQQPFLDWKYSGPVLRITDELDHLQYMMTDIDERLDEQPTWTDTDKACFERVVDVFAQKSILDISGDMQAYRERLAARIQKMNLDASAKLVGKLRRASAHTGRETAAGKVYDYWMQMVSCAETRKHLMVNHSRYDVGKIESELKLFPESMYEDWVENRSLFVSRMFYQRIPRNAIWLFISGIAFVEMMKNGADRNTQLSAKEIVDTALSMEIPVMQAAEMLLSRINDNREHVFDDDLERLRQAEDAKVARNAEPQRIGQMIGFQNIVGDLSGLKALQHSSEIKKLIDNYD